MKLDRKLWRAPGGDLVELLQEDVLNAVNPREKHVKLRNTRTHMHYLETLENFQQSYESMAHLLAIPYRTWRHRVSKYPVKVLGVYQHDATHITVRVDRTHRGPKPTSWPILKFLEAFEPLGEPMVPPTCWDRISEEEVESRPESSDGGGRADDQESHQG